MKQLVSNDVPADAKLALLKQGMQQLDQAQKLGGDHPDLFDQRGQFLFWQAVNLAKDGEERRALLSQASEQYRKALCLARTMSFLKRPSP